MSEFMSEVERAEAGVIPHDIYFDSLLALDGLAVIIKAPDIDNESDLS